MRSTHEHEDAFTLVFTPYVWSHESQLLVEPCLPCTEMKLLPPRPSSSIYFYKEQVEPVHKFQFDAFFPSLKYRFLIKCSIQASSGKQPFQTKSWSWTWQLMGMYERMIHLFMHTLNFCCSRQETVQGFTYALKSQTWKYVLHTPNKILFISDLGIIRKCNWVWSCWLIRKVEICPKTILKNSQAWHSC